MLRHRKDAIFWLVVWRFIQIHASSSSCSCFCSHFRSQLHQRRRLTDYRSALSSSLSSRNNSDNHDPNLSDSGTHHARRRSIQITESDFPGAGVPRPELQPQDIPPLLMKALQCNDFPTIDAGLSAVWEFSSDTTKFIFQNNATDFVQSAHETARDFSTSFYGVAMYGLSYEMETAINRVGGPDGWIATQVMKTIGSDGRLRRWQWELRKHKRPPLMGCWYVESIGSSDRNGQFEPE